ncbi:recombinase family protein [Streptomyces chiangmaiensis]|uniref:recombinase family protein n=1 Tax=Streptomyces chiangmaiensis TaxID=766497 RepID=UPI0031EB0C7A
MLINPRYTGYEVWNKQRKEERLLDVNDVTLGHTTRMTHNRAEQWIHSNEPAHEAIISPSRFATVQTLRRQRARNHGRQERAGKQGARPYALRGRIRCTLCGRKMQPATIRNSVCYRCEFKEQEAALHLGLDHPRTVNLREDIVCQALDQWIARAFTPDRLTATIEALTHASAAANTADPHTRADPSTPGDQGLRTPTRPRPSSPQSRSRPRRRHPMDQRGAERQGSGTDKARRAPRRHPEEGTPLDAQQIREITERLEDIAQRIRTADTEKKGPLYEALGITISYESATRTATVRSRPSSPYRQWLCPRGELTTVDTLAVAQGRLRLHDGSVGLRTHCASVAG